MAKSDGALRVFDFEAFGNRCKANETGISWKATGSPGPAGPQGPAGPKGATGPQGAPGISFARGHFRNGEQQIDTTYATLATVDLPAGMHSLQGKASASMGEWPFLEGRLVTTCRLLQKATSGAQTVHDTAFSEITDGTTDRDTIPLMGLAYVPAGQTDKLHLQCKDDGLVSGEFNHVQDVKLIAMQIGGYTATSN